MFLLVPDFFKDRQKLQWAVLLICLLYSQVIYFHVFELIQDGSNVVYMLQA